MQQRAGFQKAGLVHVYVDIASHGIDYRRQRTHNATLRYTGTGNSAPSLVIGTSLWEPYIPKWLFERELRYIYYSEISRKGLSCTNMRWASFPCERCHLTLSTVVGFRCGTALFPPTVGLYCWSLSYKWNTPTHGSKYQLNKYIILNLRHRNLHIKCRMNSRVDCR